MDCTMNLCFDLSTDERSVDGISNTGKKNVTVSIITCSHNRTHRV